MRNYTGRKLVYIPIGKEEFDANIELAIKNYLGDAIGKHNRNRREIKELKRIFNGEQPILKEKIRYDNSDINNTAVENHAFKQVNFKKGFMYGEPLEYSLSKAMDTDDLTYLNAYLTDVNKGSLDMDKSEDLFTFGVAHQLVTVRSGDYDVETEAPFCLDNIDSEDCCMVYSNDIPRVPLFGLIFAKNEKNKNIYNVYTPGKLYIFDEYYNLINVKISTFKFIALQEYCLNKSRMGIVELTLNLQNVINKLTSSQLDDVEEFVNSFFVFENVSIDEDLKAEMKELRKERMLCINTNNANIPAKFSILSRALDHNSLNLFYDRVLKAIYDIAGVPQSSGNVTSGGDTGQARLLGNGWESAQNQAKVDVQYLLKYERELIKKIISICKETSNCPINEISANFINIKFNINMSDNLIVKTQSLKNLRDINFPVKASLNAVGITADVEGVGNQWETSINEAKLEEEKQNATSQVTNQTNTDIKE